MREQWTFLVLAMSEGRKWARAVLDSVALVITLFAALVGLVAVGVLLKQPAWFLVAVVVCAAFVTFFEGTYRVWREADGEARRAQSELDREGGKRSFSLWLDERVRELRALQSSLRSVLLAGPVFDAPQARSIESSFWDVNSEVLRRLHVDAPEWVAYYQQGPEWFHSGLTRHAPDQFKDVDRLFDYTVGQLTHIKAQAAQ